MESDPKIPVTRRHPQIAVVPLTSSPANAPKIRSREIPYLKHLDKERIAGIQWVSVLDPRRWQQDFEYLCSWLNNDTSEIVHFAGLLDCPSATAATYQLVLGEDFTIPIHNPRSALADELNLRRAQRVLVLNVRCNGQRDPLRVLPVISVLLNAGAKGVVASVYPIPDVFAASFIEKFYRRFLSGHEIGEALAQTKRLFVREFNNPLALLYSPFANLQNPGLRLEVKVADAEKVPEESFSRAPQPGLRPSPLSHPLPKKFTILHLSDFHYGPEHRFSPVDYDKSLPRDDIPNLSRALINDLKCQNASVDMLVISGDIAQSGEMEQFNWAREAIEELISGLQLQMQQVVIVPGNHDIRWLKEETRILPAHDPNGNYRAFYELLYGKHRFRDPRRLFHTTFIEEKNIAMMGLDSCVIESPETAGVGYIGDKQLRVAIEEINNLTEGHSDCVKVAVLHHHLFPVQAYECIPLQGKQFSLVMDAASVLRRLYQEGFALIMHGHQHQPYCVDLRLHEYGIARKTSMAIVGAGSVGAKRAELGNIARNHYNIIEIETSNRSTQIQVMGRMSSDRAVTEFEPYPKTTVTLDLGGSVGMLS
jgi:predicted MPP superfamily phosphohydrolase